MLRVGIIGCGKIADQHAEQIVLIPETRLVGACDRESLMSNQFCERFRVPKSFTETRDLLEQTKPDIVHITTPPRSHYPVGKLCLEAGCHVYIEKPFTIDVAEARELVALAREKNLKLTVGHNAQFTDAALRMREIVASGYLGGRPLHIESYYCYNLDDPSYAKALLADSGHWVRALPGGLLQNVISHGISKIAEFMEGDCPEVTVLGSSSPLLRSIGQPDIVDELRVILRENDMTAYFTFSSQMRPGLHQLRLYGPKNGLIVDDDQQTVIRVRGRAYKSYLEQFLPQWSYAKQYLANSIRNISKFANADFNVGYGMRTLIRRFYGCILQRTPVPIPYSEIVRTTRIMDEIFLQLSTSPLLTNSRKRELVEQQ